MKITDDFRLELKPSRARHLLWGVKMNGTQRRTLVSPSRMHCIYSGMAKSTSQAEATSNSEKIKPIALAIVELCESESIRQSVRQLVSQSVENSVG